MARFRISLRQFFGILALCAASGSGCNQLLDWDARPGAVCGNGLLESGETCEAILMDVLTCQNLGYESGETQCRNCYLDETACHTCGDGRAESVEDCDGQDLRGKSCESMGYYGGKLACSADCTLNLSDCRSYGKCGDGITQFEQGELCDGWDSGEQTCADLDFWSGTLYCSEFCRVFGTGECRRAVGISVGSAHACVMDEQSIPYCWGDNTRLQAGATPGVMSVSLPQPLDEVYCAESAVPILGFDTTCFHCAPRLWCFGDNRHGQLGLSDTLNRTVPALIEWTSGNPWMEMAAGARHLCGIDTSGHAACAGANDVGQLGDGTCEDRPQFEAVQQPAQTAFMHVAAGDDFTCALDASGDTWCWGGNDFGQLGDGTQTSRSAPVRAVHELPFSAITAGDFHACALDVSGNAWCWGKNDHGQLGVGHLNVQNVPSAVHMPPGGFFRRLRCGGDSCCGVDQNSRIWCWGKNDEGQLGIGSGPDRSEPQAILAPSDASFTDVGVGGAFACALDSKSRVYCWGANSRGQLGNGSQTASPLPVRITPYGPR